MSTKIYSGYKIQGPVSFQDIAMYNNKISHAISTWINQHISNKYLRQVVRALSSHHRTGATLDLDQIWENILTSVRTESASRENSSLNLSASWAYQMHQGDLFFLFFLPTRMPDLDMPPFQFYGYWDNSDAPDDVTEDEWEQRMEDWGAIGILDNPPSVSMLCVTHEHNAFERPTTLPWSFHSQEFKWQVTNEVIDEIVSQLCKDQNIGQDEISRTMSVAYDTATWLKTPEGQALLDQRVLEASQVYPFNADLDLTQI